MQRLGHFCAVLILLGLLAGSNTMGRQPVMRDARIVPADLKPGDTAIISIAVSDRYGIVDRIEGVVREDPRVKFRLRDDGIEPDETAQDGIWTLQVDVPFQAPPGAFTLDFAALRADGEIIIVRDTEGNDIPLSETFEMVIRYPEQPQP